MIHYHFLAGADYNSTTRILTLKGTHSRIGVQVPIILDEFAEVNEQFRGTLSLVDDNGINVNVRPDQSIVEIINSKCNRKEAREMKAFCILLLYSSYCWVC